MHASSEGSASNSANEETTTPSKWTVTSGPSNSITKSQRRTHRRISNDGRKIKRTSLLPLFSRSRPRLQQKK